MRRLIFALPSILLLSLFTFTAAFAAEPLRVVAGTSLITDIVNDLTAGDSEVITIIQGSSCPGHENAKTQDFVFAAKADLVLIHPFQRHMLQVTTMLDAVGNASLKLVAISPKGSWLIPEIQKQAVLEIAEALCAVAPQKAETIQQRTRQRIEKVTQADRECREHLRAVAGKPVIVAAMQSEFVQWAGFSVLRSFGRIEEINARELASIMTDTKGKKVCGVIDNYQSGMDAGLPLALELGVPHVVLSNFPGSADDVPDYFSLLQANVAQLSKL
ncbi:metal ABC transporter substrate-binding protein [Desulfovibrio intestinalis]|uniref:Zinc transport system substrate-binding protein n=1 Tax=Desulfovibrio intestinalis TaxID=58621 RepID=A0A7W8FEE2_9BACT|nr:zinc ABC transporter substrate-binding protein [Desulfovibrio intestinalis]MBB5143689.1 zinc transport system substrate-binding protein [Desulfovibrio intestinalis]